MVKILQKENLPGGGTLHSMMTPHGPDNKTFLQTSQQELKPVKVEGTMVCWTYVYTILLLASYIEILNHIPARYPVYLYTVAIVV